MDRNALLTDVGVDAASIRMRYAYMEGMRAGLSQIKPPRNNASVNTRLVNNRLYAHVARGLELGLQSLETHPFTKEEVAVAKKEVADLIAGWTDVEL